MGLIFSLSSDIEDFPCCQDCVNNNCSDKCDNNTNCSDYVNDCCKKNEELESKIKDLEIFCRNLENRIINLEKNRRTIYL